MGRCVLRGEGVAGAGTWAGVCVGGGGRGSRLVYGQVCVWRLAYGQ